MAANLRLEYVVAHDNGISWNVAQAQDIAVSGAQVLSAVAPDFAGPNGFARVSVTSGAVLAYASSNPVVTSTNGILVTSRSGPVLLHVNTGQQVALVEAVGDESLCLDLSLNKLALPVVGSAFGNSGPFANFVLIGTVNANSARSSLELQCITGSAQIVSIRDDGSAVSGAAPLNASLVIGNWSTTTFRGRLQVYAASPNTSVSIFSD